MKSFESVLGAAPCELNGYEIWEVLNAQERIEAIPISWLEEQAKKHSDAVFEPHWYVMKEWQEKMERERDGESD